ncbi:hypothetical protein ABT336_03430 [Micromonospora sp. NPDC000207]|uniref:scabin-related ADP-ribosyltransferase n=1 Tax=Micromonospora sp. NPDC000207 TaxID=3154246 RepID=UPI00332738CC
MYRYTGFDTPANVPRVDRAPLYCWSPVPPEEVFGEAHLQPPDPAIPATLSEHLVQAETCILSTTRQREPGRYVLDHALERYGRPSAEFAYRYTIWTTRGYDMNSSVGRSACPSGDEVAFIGALHKDCVSAVTTYRVQDLVKQESESNIYLSDQAERLKEAWTRPRAHLRVPPPARRSSYRPPAGQYGNPYGFQPGGPRR